MYNSNNKRIIKETLFRFAEFERWTEPSSGIGVENRALSHIADRCCNLIPPFQKEEWQYEK